MDWLGLERSTLMDGARRQKPRDRLAFGQFDPDPAEKRLADSFGRPAGHDRPPHFPAGIGQRGLYGMKAIKPVFATRPGLGISTYRLIAFFRPFYIGLWVEMTPVFLTAFTGGLGSHAGAYKGVWPGVNLEYRQYPGNSRFSAKNSY
jgi:hypothetical protein